MAIHRKDRHARKKGIALLLALASLHASAGDRPYVHDLDRRFDQYTWVTTHNSFNTRLSPVPNQSRDISQQLIDGVRGLSLDLHEFGLPAGTTFTLFDSPNGKRSDDYTTIRVLGDITNRSVVIPSFHTSYNDGNVSVDARYRNGLDGKISRVELTPATSQPTPPIIRLPPPGSRVEPGK
ncbi:hypothetical protein EC912_102565 [Luteibacter rhizovicinus]|uniref:Uncharacterized protein n=1 Tax=Luteibacter rhizovicinus TaxID=242606 RepID=A0A4R3YT75_9GAMM|nr:hypothetical protein [Luteibacter rhizovicinus]TCV96215.1 hypothetical protein EC912_102565 [Luteibacter rhizovicinus]